MLGALLFLIAATTTGATGTGAGVNVVAVATSCIEDIYPAFAGTTMPSYMDDFQCPTAPVTDGGTATVSNATEWDNCVEHDSACDGDVITIGASFTLSGSEGTVNCDDCIINAAGRTITGTIDFSGARVQWNDGSVIGRCEANDNINGGTTDLLIDNLNCTTTANTAFTWAVSGNWNRVAIINSTFDNGGSGNEGSWAFFVQPTDSNGFNEVTDTSGEVVTDADAAFDTIGLEVGVHQVKNNTDTDLGNTVNSLCTITEITSTTLTCDPPGLVGGNDNQWTDGDEWKIEVGPTWSGMNLLIAGSRLQSGAQVNRFQDIKNFVFFDNLSYNDNFSTSTFRQGHDGPDGLSSGVQNSFVSNNLYVPGRWIDHVVWNFAFENNTNYNDSAINSFSIMCGPNITNGTSDGNDTFCSSTGWPGPYSQCNGAYTEGSEPSSGTCTGTNNNVQAWNPQSLPSFVGYGADH